ncbi:MAG: hypothetical protein VX473_02305 [Candidatus Thermoplasmatota archaeon]|jgi:hypothetical protein|nr:hypothetical protein [Candidatus Thermoplasmatota archaeon]|tara:strand:+ start:536 stop:742 length:207 start_codon:yes stop_codon:yes gene_type:complete
MGVGKAIVFGLFAMIPGALLALFGYMLIGSPETWQNSQYLACYGPFFGSIAIGVWLGIRGDSDVELET